MVCRLDNLNLLKENRSEIILRQDSKHWIALLVQVKANGYWLHLLIEIREKIQYLKGVLVSVTIYNWTVALFWHDSFLRIWKTQSYSKTHQCNFVARPNRREVDGNESRESTFFFFFFLFSNSDGGTNVLKFPRCSIVSVYLGKVRCSISFHHHCILISGEIM